MTYQSIDCGGCAPPVQASTEGIGMSDIPEEIWKEARKVAEKALEDGHDHVRACDIDMVIARALLSAEARGMERAAKIAEEKKIKRFDGMEAWIHSPTQSEIVSAIRAAAIRNSTEA